MTPPPAFLAAAERLAHAILHRQRADAPRAELLRQYVAWKRAEMLPIAGKQ
jgi:hypothetical protein